MVYKFTISGTTTVSSPASSPTTVMVRVGDSPAIVIPRGGVLHIHTPCPFCKSNDVSIEDGCMHFKCANCGELFSNNGETNKLIEE